MSEVAEGAFEEVYPGQVPEIYHFHDDKPRDYCGVFGVISTEFDVARAALAAGTELQHRGQEAAGVSVGNGVEIEARASLGLMTQVFHEESDLPSLEGAFVASSHNRYSTHQTERKLEAAQPMIGTVGGVDISLATNGNITNLDEIIARHPDANLDPASDSQLLVWDIERSHTEGETLEDTIAKAAQNWKGAFSLVITTPDRIIGARDRNGFRPLFLFKVDGGYAFGSETTSTRAEQFKSRLIGEVSAGEMISIDKNGMRRRQLFENDQIDLTLCSFEAIYLTKPSAEINGMSVYQLRQAMGRKLAEADLKASGGEPIADIVVGVPQSGLPAAKGYAAAMGIEDVDGLERNPYMGRTFIQPEGRGKKVQAKMSVLDTNVEGKSIVLVDDSIVRGTTTKALVTMLRDAGVTSVHLRSASPAIKDTCHFGIDTPDREDLLAGTNNLQKMADFLNVDSLRFLDTNVLRGILQAQNHGYCFACMTGKYPHGSLPETPVEVGRH